MVSTLINRNSLSGALINTPMRLNDLFESINMSVEDTVAAFRRDPAVAPIFKRNAPAVDPEALVVSYQRLVLSNQTLRQWMSQHNIYYPLRPREWKDDYVIEQIIRVIKEISRKATSSAKGRLSADTLKELVEWIETNGSRRFLSLSAQRELLATPGIRPDKPVKLYRGMMFRNNSFDRDPNDTRSPAALQQAIRSGKTSLKFNHESPSSWTPATETAEKFARYNSANSEFEAMSYWFGRSKRNEFIDGALGVVLATLARPEDILCDIGMIDFGNRYVQIRESEILLRPGSILCKIDQAYNKDGPIALGVAPEETPAERLIGTLKKTANNINLQFRRAEGPTSNSYTGFFDETLIRHSVEIGPSIFTRGQTLVDAIKPTLDTLGEQRLDPSQVSPDQQPTFKALTKLVQDIKTSTSAPSFEASMVAYCSPSRGRSRDILDYHNRQLFAASMHMETGKYPHYRERVPIYKTMKSETQEKRLGKVVDTLLEAGGRDINQPWISKVRDLGKLIIYVQAVGAAQDKIESIIDNLREIEG